MFGTVYYAVQGGSHVYPSLYTIYPCLPQFIHDLPRLAMFTPVYTRFTHVYHSLSTFYPIYPCLPQFIHILPRLPMFTAVYPHFTPFTLVYRSLSCGKHG